MDTRTPNGLPYVAGYHPYYTYPIFKKAEVEEAHSEKKMTIIPLHYPTNYGLYSHPLTHYYRKRDAQDEAEADPWLAYGYHGYGLRPYGYRSYYGGYPYGYRYGGYGYPFYG